MGFTLMYKRISYSLVVTLMLKVGTYMPLFFTLMLSFIKVEDEAKSLAAKEEEEDKLCARNASSRVHWPRVPRVLFVEFIVLIMGCIDCVRRSHCTTGTGHTARPGDRAHIYERVEMHLGPARKFAEEGSVCQESGLRQRWAERARVLVAPRRGSVRTYQLGHRW